MKIAISATGPGLDSEIDPRFGRSEYFVIVEPDTMRFETLTNPNPGAPSGAGIGTAQFVCNKGVEAVITGNIGPKAHQVLSAAGVRMLTGVSGKVSDAIEMFKSGKLTARVDTGSGPEMGASPAMGSGMRMGTGRGMGMGRGMGRGVGCGGGRGMGMGGGWPQAPGMRSLRDWESEPWSGRAREPSVQEDLTSLKQQAKTLAEELRRIEQRIEEMEKK